VLSCAGAYVYGDANSNECPAGSTWILTEAACKTAAAAEGKEFAMAVTDADAARGCSYHLEMFKVCFNGHAVGAAFHMHQLLCITTSAPPHADARPRVHRRVQRHCASAQRRACVPHARACDSCGRVWPSGGSGSGGGERTLRIVWRGSDGGAVRYGHGQGVCVRRIGTEYSRAACVYYRWPIISMHTHR
jgi:hypothetical protein